MRASIIQLKEVLFHRIFVEAGKALEEVVPGEAGGFDFNEVGIRVRLECGSANSETEENQRAFAVTLGIAIDNAEGKPAPYKIDLLAVGLIEVADVVEKEKRADLATINGASLLYGAIRELVTTLTSRGIPGALVLPTVDFRDHLQQPSDPKIEATTGKKNDAVGSV